MSKKTTKTRTARKKTTPIPPITDAHLIALLSFITYGDHKDDGGHSAATFANAARAAQSMLTTQPLTSAFGLLLHQPSVYDEVSKCLAAHIRHHWTDPKDSIRAFNAIETARREENDDDVKAHDVMDLLPSYMDQALLLGACLMYELLKGGAR